MKLLLFRWMPIENHLFCLENRCHCWRRKFADAAQKHDRIACVVAVSRLSHCGNTKQLRSSGRSMTALFQLATVLGMCLERPFCTRLWSLLARVEVWCQGGRLSLCGIPRAARRILFETAQMQVTHAHTIAVARARTEIVSVSEDCSNG